MLKIHTGLRKFTKEDRFHILLKKMNPQGINRPCQNIEKDEIFFEIYRIALKRDKDAIDIDGNDAFDSYRLFFYFMLRMFGHLNQLYEMEKSLLIDAILKYHLRKQSAKENLSEPSSSTKESAKENTSMPSPSRKESVEENKSKPSPSRIETAKENTSKPPPTKGSFEGKTKRTCQANSDSYNKDYSLEMSIHLVL